MTRFLYVSDVPWWCIARHGIALSRGISRWDHVTVDKFRSDEGYDAIVVGSLPIYYSMIQMGHRIDPNKLFVTLASHRDRKFHVMVKNQRAIEIVPEARALIVNDPRFPVDTCLPVICRPDRVDGNVFSFCEPKTPRDRIVVGWAGSNQVWGIEKNLTIIERVVQLMGDKIEFRWQRREVEGIKSASEMKDWYHDLDVYICMNQEYTPNSVPVLEALSCGIPVITTRCGTVWQSLYHYCPDWVVSCNVPSMVSSLTTFTLNEGSWKVYCERLRETTVCNNIEEMKTFTRNLEAFL